MKVSLTQFACGLGAITLLHFAAHSSAQAATIRLRPSAVVTATVIELGDVADIEDSDAELVEKLRHVTLAPAPAAGRKLRLDFAQIRSKLASQGVNLAAVDFTGSSLIEVASGQSETQEPQRRLTGRAADLQRERAEKLVSDAVQGYLRGRAPELGRASVSVQLRNEDVSLILSGVASGFQIAGGSAPWDVPQQMAVAFMDRDENVHRLTIVCEIAAQPHVLVARHAIPRGQVLRESDLTWQQLDVAEAVLNRLEDAVGRETTRAILQGQPIAVDDVQSQELVRSNDIVKTYVRKGSITITSYLKARSSAGLGESVTLTTLDGRERILARVIGLHEAEVVGSDAAPLSRPVPSNPIQLTAGERSQPNSAQQYRRPAPPQGHRR